jgi:hypothetical protein
MAHAQVVSLAVAGGMEWQARRRDSRASLDDLVGSGEQRRRHSEAEQTHPQCLIRSSSARPAVCAENGQ